MSKLIKIAGVYVATEVVFALGKGHMLAYLRKYYPETWEAIRKRMEASLEAKERSCFHRALGTVICKSDDVFAYLYDKDEVRKERG